jgi:Leucine-rich repeat (LRR) protein
VTGKGIESLAGLNRLERLSLWQAKKIDDNAVAAIAALKNLKTLDVSETSIGDAGLEKLTLSLTSLYLTGSRVTEAGVEAFGRTHPKCRVFWK